MAEKQGHILVVDDNRLNRMKLAHSLRQEGYTSDMAEDGRQALEMLRVQPFDLVLLDIMMPEMDGYAVLEEMKHDRVLRDIPVIVISALEELESVVKGIVMGAEDYLPKAFDPVILKARIGASLEKKRLRDQEATYRQQIEEYNRRLESRVQEQVEQLLETHEQLRKALDGVVLALSSALERRDPYTAGHQQRVCQLACAIAKEMMLPDNQIEGIRIASILHDIGKISVPAEILSKPGALNAEEFNLIKLHAKTGYEILKGIEFPWPVAQIVNQHQEKIDGSGYPLKLSGEEILLEARIIEVADVVEAMSSHRPYRPSLGMDKALHEIKTKKGICYDPGVVDACLKLFTEKNFSFD